jgi:tRNA (adenine22-N1)-methyltransferase
MILDTRLRAAAEMVPAGARLADIGSDHAYLPIALCLEGKIEYALASDINEGPVASARTNIAKNGLVGKIEAIRADGLDDARDFAPDCITVLGMGGELIVTILDRAEWVTDERITLVLQPMTHAEILSEYLASNGFAVLDERIVSVGERDDRIYRLIKARFDGKKRDISTVESLVGRINLERCDEVTKRYISRIIAVLNTKIQGKEKANLDTSEERALISELEKYL